MSKFFIAIGLLFFMSSAQAQTAKPVDLKHRALQLVELAKDLCGIPDKIHPYADFQLNRFVSQVYFPELKMLATAFLRGFMLPNSAYIPMGYCVVAFMNQPKDPSWEPHLDAVKQATERGVLPPYYLSEVTEEGEVVLMPF